MSYNAVPTVATGDVWTATNHNLYIRDNFRAVVPDVVAAKGEMIIGDGADALSLLSIGDDDKILFGDIAWNMPDDLFHFCSSNANEKEFGGPASGNYHVPTDFDVPEGVSWIYCRMRLYAGVSTARFVLYPSYDTTIEAIRVDGAGNTDAYVVSHGVIPLDSTGGLFYGVASTVTYARLAVHAWMY